MFIAQQLKQKNIAEYLLYMWQVEDLIRANKLDVEKIEETVVSQYDLEDTQKKALITWYEDLIRMMHEEGVTEKGHLQINKNVLINLTDLHLQLANSPKYPFYGAAYFKALPFIVELRNKSGKKEELELETCFEALYGAWLLKLQKKEMNPETSGAINKISSFISLLAGYYDKEKKGELNLDE